MSTIHTDSLFNYR